MPVKACFISGQTYVEWRYRARLALGNIDDHNSSAYGVFNDVRQDIIGTARCVPRSKCLEDETP